MLTRAMLECDACQFGVEHVEDCVGRGLPARLCPYHAEALLAPTVEAKVRPVRPAMGGRVVVAPGEFCTACGRGHDKATRVAVLGQWLKRNPDAVGDEIHRQFPCWYGWDCWDKAGDMMLYRDAREAGMARSKKRTGRAGPRKAVEAA